MNFQAVAQTLRSQTLPAAFVDLEAFDQNARDLVRRAGGKPIRLATKSLRCVELIRRALAQPGFQGLLTYSAAETLALSHAGFDDLVLAYPTMEAEPVNALLKEIAKGRNLTFMVDHPEQLEFLELRAAEARIPAPVALDLDLSSRWPALNFGVYRSAVHTIEQLEPFLRALDGCKSVRLRGLMGYEAQIAGVPNGSPLIRFLQQKSGRRVLEFRAAAVARLRERGHRLEFVNGGGTGSLEFTSKDPSVTELAAGSGLYAPALFDGYSHFHPAPALGFALRVTRAPVPGIVTCHGGGVIASGDPGKNRLPLPVYPAGLEYCAHEGAGEVQTPLRARGVVPQIGDAVLFRPAKAGESLERFHEVLLLEGGRITGSARTYRGEGWTFS